MNVTIINRFDLGTCLECGGKFDTLKKKAYHLKTTHSLNTKEYITKHYFNNSLPKCQCGKCNDSVSFKVFEKTIEYSKYTKNHFPRKPKTEEQKQRGYTRTKQAMLAKYGVDNVFKLKEIQEKIKNTNLEKYGTSNAMLCEDVKKKNQHPQSKETKEKIKSTNLEKYGAHSYTASKNGKAAIKKKIKEKYGVSSTSKLPHIKEKIKKTNLEKYGYESNLADPEFRKKYNGKTSKIEKIVCEKLEATPKFVLGGREFDMVLENHIIEVDGDFYHANKLENLTLMQLNASINDFEKEAIVKNNPQYSLTRIKVSKLPEDIILESIQKNSYSRNYNIEFDTTILSKEYLKKYIEKNGKQSLEKHLPIIIKFVRTFMTGFPHPKSKESSESILKDIRNQDFSKIIKGSHEYSNVSNNKGVSFLKERFNSFWESRYKGNKSPKEAFSDDEILKKIISYRIGLNNQNEIFGLSKRTIIQGLTVNRFPVSFFKPSLAYAVYKDNLGDVESPTVFDPCAGFGGRLLGFKAAYPNGTYIGVEPNTETYKELISLVDELNLKNVTIINKKLEEIDVSAINHDYAFTSIPYQNTELYSNGVGVENWDLFLEKLKTIKNLHINVNIKTFESDLKSDYNIIGKIHNNSSPMNKKSGRHELIVYLI